jgi:chromosome segregation protein
MRLKSLELVGFKSFFEPTIINFSPGITAVVGPNGCGKSNVVDAIRWVLGEQAPTRLRGKSAEDLIYVGNDSHPPAGMAEVSLVLEAEEGSSLPDPYSMLSEVCVARRVYRSGDTEYLLNKIPCRLKDITEFFMAAQIHSRSYALIEQGRIEEIIQSKPAELHALIEEAAGLSLFKGRREISERKLERVKENLARVDDVLSEIERQLGFARRQAKKAEAYKLVRSELTELEKMTAARRLLDQRTEFERQSARKAELKAEAEAARARSAALETELEDIARALRAKRDQLSAAVRELENLHAGSAERARTRSFLQRRLEALDQLEPVLVGRLTELEAKAVLSRAARAEMGARLARESSGGDGGSEAALEELRRRYEAAQKDLRESEKGIEDLKDELSDRVREAAVTRSRLADLTGERAELEERLREGNEEMSALAPALKEAQEELLALEAALGAARDETAALEAAERESAECEFEARTTLEGLSPRLTAMREEAALVRTSAQHPAREAAAERLRTVLESLNGDRPAGEPSLLADVIKAPAAFEPALRAALGEQLDAVIVDSPHFALRAIEILKEKQGGRLSFIPDSLAAVPHPAVEAPGIAGRLLNMLQVDTRFGALAEALVGHVLVADDLRSALSASNLNGKGTLFVTREGDIVWPGHMISGGSTHLGADRSDGSLSVETAALKAVEAEAEYKALQSRLEEERAKRARTQAALEQTRRRAAQAAHATGEKRAAIGKLEQRIAFRDAYQNDAKRRLAELADLVVALNARLEELAIGEQEARARLDTIRSELAAREASVEELGKAMLDLASKVEARKARLHGLEQELHHLSDTADDLESQIDQHRASLERSRVESVEFHGELEKLGEQEAAARGREIELKTATEELKARCEEGEPEVDSRRAELGRAREVLDAVEHEIVECGLRCERARTLSEELERSFAEKFQVGFTSVAAELEAAFAGRDAARDEQRLAELRAKAERIGEVNLAAESEVEELEQRASLLGTERSDLQAAVNDLSQTIDKLNREARRRFAETFEGAARNFAELFPKLLRGGKGRLELQPANDALEAGVNIFVQPAAKKVKEIGLLSGGEKALSAMALIFSLFLLNPSPFCLMDEVDAPLDEFSLAAFTSLLDELKQRSQFIVITHNQRTMQRADHIHGVTMEQPGISRIISLKISQAA